MLVFMFYTYSFSRGSSVDVFGMSGAPDSRRCGAFGDILAEIFFLGSSSSCSVSVPLLLPKRVYACSSASYCLLSNSG